MNQRGQLFLVLGSLLLVGAFVTISAEEDEQFLQLLKRSADPYDVEAAPEEEANLDEEQDRIYQLVKRSASPIFFGKQGGGRRARPVRRGCGGGIGKRSPEPLFFGGGNRRRGGRGGRGCGGGQRRARVSSKGHGK